MGMLIDYGYCTGCHSCEVSCKERFNLPTGEFGIKLSQNGPWQHGDDWEWEFVPIPTHYCDFCQDRIDKGKKALCEQHCQALVITVGPLKDLVKQMNDTKNMTLYNKTNAGGTLTPIF
jgi:anaerobic dimethyl sulfoxide reductase subunit B (iron-sulfur subunit)